MTRIDGMSTPEDRLIELGTGTASIPERLLLQHAEGRVLFISGAGTSMPSLLPSFRKLTLGVYELLDKPVYDVLKGIPEDACNKWAARSAGLRKDQIAEIGRFVTGDYDVVLGMLERRIDGPNRVSSRVRESIATILETVVAKGGGNAAPKPSAIHRALIRLADRGSTVTIATTNFDLLLEASGRRGQARPATRSLGAIPRPGLSREFAGVLHIHGTCFGGRCGGSELVVTDQDFGEYYLRRRIVPDFVYDAARLFHLVLVGYSANDAPMRYLLNAVAADGSRFGDLRERYAFVAIDPSSETDILEDWRARGITPIPYSTAKNHQQLSDTLVAWARFSTIVGDSKLPERVVRRLTRVQRAKQNDADRDLVDFLLRRSEPSMRECLVAVATSAGADRDWLDAFIEIGRDVDRRRHS